MSREIRRVPADWRHPKDDKGHFKPLYDGWRKYLSDKEAWLLGTHPQCDPTLSWEDYAGNHTAEDYMPDWPEADRTHYQIYETCTEGTPITPVLASFDAVCQWAADNHACVFGPVCDYTADQWKALLRREVGGVRVEKFIFT